MPLVPLMRRIVVIPDSFKGTIPSSRFCELAERAIHRHFPDCAFEEVRGQAERFLSEALDGAFAEISRGEGH